MTIKKEQSVVRTAKKYLKNDFMIQEDTIDYAFVKSLQKCLRKYANSFDGEMNLCLKCEPAYFNGGKTVIITEIEWEFKK